MSSSVPVRATEGRSSVNGDPVVGKRVLIVDDKAEVRDTVVEFMRRSGFEAESAASVEGSLALMRLAAFDIVITDIQFPSGLGGLDLIQIVKRDHPADVIAMTGYSHDYSYEEVVSRGASDFIVKPFRTEELLLRVQRVLRERELAEERNRMMEKLQQLAVTDGLTSLFNSRHFHNQIELEVDRCVRYQHSLSMLLIDIDHFKEFNDKFGHLEGDKVLVRFSQILKSCLRTNDSAYRYGGEEFTVILPETGAEEARTVAQRIRSAMEAEVFHIPSGRSVSKTISIGVTEYSPMESIAVFIRRADQAMYVSKQNGRNRVSVLAAPAEKSSSSTM